jgi:hypothetical protein
LSGVAGIAFATALDIVWIGVGPDPSGSVSATYTGRSTVTHVVRPSPGIRNHCTSSTP